MALRLEAHLLPRPRTITDTIQILRPDLPASDRETQVDANIGYCEEILREQQLQTTLFQQRALSKGLSVMMHEAEEICRLSTGVLYEPYMGVVKRRGLDGRIDGISYPLPYPFIARTFEDRNKMDKLISGSHLTQYWSLGPQGTAEFGIERVHNGGGIIFRGGEIVLPTKTFGTDITSAVKKRRYVDLPAGGPDESGNSLRALAQSESIEISFIRKQDGQVVQFALPCVTDEEARMINAEHNALIPAAIGGGDSPIKTEPEVVRSRIHYVFEDQYQLARDSWQSKVVGQQPYDALKGGTVIPHSGVAVDFVLFGYVDQPVSDYYPFDNEILRSQKIDGTDADRMRANDTLITSLDELTFGDSDFVKGLLIPNNRKLDPVLEQIEPYHLLRAFRCRLQELQSLKFRSFSLPWLQQTGSTCS